MDDKQISFDGDDDLEEAPGHEDWKDLGKKPKSHRVEYRFIVQTGPEVLALPPGSVKLDDVLVDGVSIKRKPKGRRDGAKEKNGNHQ